MKEEAFMNYGKRKASKKQKRITSKKNMHKKKLGVRLFKGFLLCIFVCCILAAIGGGFIIRHVIDNAPEITADSIKPQGYTSTALADAERFGSYSIVLTTAGTTAVSLLKSIKRYFCLRPPPM